MALSTTTDNSTRSVNTVGGPVIRYDLPVLHRIAATYSLYSMPIYKFSCLPTSTDESRQGRYAHDTSPTDLRQLEVGYPPAICSGPKRGAPSFRPAPPCQSRIVRSILLRHSCPRTLHGLTLAQSCYRTRTMHWKHLSSLPWWACPQTPPGCIDAPFCCPSHAVLAPDRAPRRLQASSYSPILL